MQESQRGWRDLEQPDEPHSDASSRIDLRIKLAACMKLALERECRAQAQVELLGSLRREQYLHFAGCAAGRPPASHQSQMRLQALKRGRVHTQWSNMTQRGGGKHLEIVLLNSQRTQRRVIEIKRLPQRGHKLLLQGRDYRG